MKLSQRIEILKTELEFLNKSFQENNLDGAMRLVPHILSDTDKLVKELTGEGHVQTVDNYSFSDPALGEYGSETG